MLCQRGLGMGSRRDTTRLIRLLLSVRTSIKRNLSDTFKLNESAADEHRGRGEIPSGSTPGEARQGRSKNRRGLAQQGSPRARGEYKSYSARHSPSRQWP